MLLLNLCRPILPKLSPPSVVPEFFHILPGHLVLRAPLGHPAEAEAVGPAICTLALVAA